MSASGGAQGGQQNEQREDGQIVIAGGELRHVVLGSQHIESQTVINNTINPVGASETAVALGTFEIQSRIKVHELNPISASSRIFNGDLCSRVTGTMPIVVKLTPFGPRFVREAKIHFSVPHHRNIVERIATDTFNYRGLPTIFIAMERCDCNLYEHVKSEVRDGVQFDVEKYTWIAYQILVGLNFLHSNNVVHGDFKPANVLLILNGNIIKLSDFGLSRAITHGNTYTHLSAPQGGTTGWLAPEVLEGTVQISKATDIFPCGLTLHFVWSHGKHAYGDRTVSLNHFIAEGINLDLSRMLVLFEADAKTLLEKTLQRNPIDRPTTGELLQSPIFNRFGPQQTRVDDIQVAEALDQSLRFMDLRGAEPSNLNEDELIPYGVTICQLQAAIRLHLERNQLQVTPISLSDGEPTFASRLSESSLLSQSVSEIDPTMDSAFEGQSETTNPKQTFLEYQESNSNQQFATSHQSRNIDRSELDEASASEDPQRLKAFSQLLRRASSLRRPRFFPKQAHQRSRSTSTPASEVLQTHRSASVTEIPIPVTRTRRITSVPESGSLLDYVLKFRRFSSGIAGGSSPSSRLDPAQSRVDRPLGRETGDSLGSTLRRHDCDVIFASPLSWDRALLGPILSSLTTGAKSYNGKREFIHCDVGSNASNASSNVEMIQERLLEMPACDDGITTIIVAYWNATVPMIRALEESNLRRFLQNKGFSGEDLKHKIQNMRRNLAVYIFEPRGSISQDSAKIAVNIHLSKDKCDGKQRTVTLRTGEVVNNITFQGRWSALLLPAAEDFINNEELMTFIRGTL